MQSSRPGPARVVRISGWSDGVRTGLGNTPIRARPGADKYVTVSAGLGLRCIWICVSGGLFDRRSPIRGVAKRDGGAVWGGMSLGRTGGN